MSNDRATRPPAWTILDRIRAYYLERPIRDYSMAYLTKAGRARSLLRLTCSVKQNVDSRSRSNLPMYGQNAHRPEVVAQWD